MSRGSKKFGDKCESTLECGFPGSICDSKKKSCQCVEDLPVTNHIDKCGKGMFNFNSKRISKAYWQWWFYQFLYILHICETNYFIKLSKACCILFIYIYIALITCTISAKKEQMQWIRANYYHANRRLDRYKWCRHCGCKYPLSNIYLQYHTQRERM